MCNMPCLCPDGIKCDTQTGKCICPPGRTGESCEKGRSNSSSIEIHLRNSFMYNGGIPRFSPECDEGRYGADCQLTCHCENGADCDNITGECICPKGWLGTSCSISEGMELSSPVPLMY